MAPERLRGQRGTPQVDVWAAGVLLYEMLVGRLPWKNPDELTLVNEILMMDELPLRSRIRPIAGPEFVELMKGMLAWSPPRRLSDGGAVLARITELTGWSARPRPTERAPSEAPKSGRRTSADSDVPPTVAAPPRESSQLDPTVPMPVRNLDDTSS